MINHHIQLWKSWWANLTPLLNLFLNFRNYPTVQILRKYPQDDKVMKKGDTSTLNIPCSIFNILSLC